MLRWHGTPSTLKWQRLPIAAVPTCNHLFLSFSLSFSLCLTSRFCLCPRCPFSYLFGLLWLFAGVALLADAFMAAIEVITSEEVTKNDGSRDYKAMVWNPTVANLTLMALGSSAPEIVLAIVEIAKNDMFTGDLGPSTIVGSAAFNL